MTRAQTRFVNILQQPESKVGFDGLVSSTNYYLSLNDDDRAQIRSLIMDLTSTRIPVVLDLMLYVIMGCCDRLMLPILRMIASEENTTMRDVAWDVLTREADGWPETPPHRPWIGPPLRAYDKEVDLRAELQKWAAFKQPRRVE